MGRERCRSQSVHAAGPRPVQEGGRRLLRMECYRQRPRPVHTASRTLEDGREPVCLGSKGLRPESMQSKAGEKGSQMIRCRENLPGGDTAFPRCATMAA